MKSLWLTLAAVLGIAPVACAEPVTLDNSRLTLAVDAATGELTSLRDHAGREFLADQKAQGLFQVELSDPEDPTGKRTTFSSRDAKKVTVAHDPGKGSLRWTFSDLGGQGVNVVCSAEAKKDDPYLRWRLEATFPTSMVLELVRYPTVALRVPTDKSASDALVMGNTKGGVRRDWAGRKVGTGFSANQPGSLAAQFACYYDNAAGLMTAAFDARGYRKTISATRVPEGVKLRWEHPCFATSRWAQDYDVVWTTFSSPDAGRPTDWRDAADLYKAWAVAQPWCKQTLVNRQDLPAWLRQGPAMVRFHRNWLSEPETVERWLTNYWRAEFGTDIPLIIAYWGWEKIATWITPEYFPVYPSDEQFRHLAQFGRELGGHTFLWPSGYHYTLTHEKQPDGSFLWDDRQRFEAIARPHAVCGRDGQVIFRNASWLKGGQTATMCGGDPWTIDWFNQICVGCAQRGAELIQVDQVVGGNWPVCYNPNHGHPLGPGCWPTDAFRRQLQTMLAACRRVQPDAIVCFEEPNEQFIQEIGVQDYRDWEVLKHPGTEPASVFSYLYHEYLPVFQSNPRPRDRLDAAYCLVNGQIPHFVPMMDKGPGSLLVNGQFEQPLGTGWDKVPGYKGKLYTGEAAIEASQRHEGTMALRLTNREQSQIVQVSQNVPIAQTFQIGHTYRLSLWVKSSGMQRTNSIGLAGLGHTQEPRITGSWSIPIPKTASEWTLAQVQFKLPQGSSALRIMLNLHEPGTVWIDDVQLDEIVADGSASPVMRPTKPSDHELMRTWVKLFHGEGRPYLLLGKMIHPPLLQTDKIESHGCRFPAILHNAYEALDGSRALVLVNVTETPQEARFSWNAQPQLINLQPWEVRLLK
jgi:hypothetical protein